MRDVLLAMGGHKAIAALQGIDDYTRKVLYMLLSCGSGYFGTNFLECESCETRMAVARTCHCRHCPSCVGKAGQEWAENIESKLLPTAYFHVIFTLPSGPLRTLMRSNQVLLYNLLMKSSKDTLLSLFAEQTPLGGVPSLLQVLHTTNQQLGFHPHVHTLVSGGSYNKTNDVWIPCKDPTFLFPYQEVATRFRDRFVLGLLNLYTSDLLTFDAPNLQPLRQKEAFEEMVWALADIDWNVELIETFSGPASVIKYLARYTHRTAISDARLLKLDGKQLTFAYKDRSRKTIRKSGNPAGVDKVRTLSVEDFIALFIQHILPCGYHRIRRCGLLAPGAKRSLQAALTAAKKAVDEGLEPAQPPIDTEDPVVEDPAYKREPSRCPSCNSDQLLLVASSVRRGPGNYETNVYDRPPRGPPSSDRQASEGAEA